MAMRIPPVNFIKKILTSKEQEDAVKNTGHAIVRTSKHIFKYNKNDKEIASLIEFTAHQLIRQFLPANTPDIELIMDDDGEEYKIAGVAVAQVPNLTVMTVVNIIELMAELEGFQPTIPYQHEDEKLAQELRAYFSHPMYGSERRLHCFGEYMAIIFLRYLLQEDDGHKGNYGYHFDPNSKDALQLFGIDFDMTLYSSISAHFNMVRLSQWGSPFHRFKLTFDDVMNYPFIRHSVPGHHPGIQANTLESHSITNNPGRYLKSDVEALSYLCKLEHFKLRKQNNVFQITQKFLAFNAKEFEYALSDYTPGSLTEMMHVTTPPGERVNFPHIVACAVANIQVSLFSELAKASRKPQDPFCEQIIELKNHFSRKYQRYLTEEPYQEYRKKFNDFCRVKTRAEAFKDVIAIMEADHLLHFDERRMKHFAIVLAEESVKDADKDDLQALMGVLHDDLSHNFIARSRESNALARQFKNHFYNHMTSTYVSIRDVLLRRALQLRSEGVDVGDLIAELVNYESVISSHSKRPLSLIHRIRLQCGYTILGNYNALTLNNYFYSKIGLEKCLLYSGIFSLFIIAKDLFCFVLQLIPIVIELSARAPRRAFADLMRYISKQHYTLKNIYHLFSALIWFVSTLLQYSAKILFWLIRKITCPLISAEEDSNWIEKQISLKTRHANLAAFFGVATYGVSILLTCVLYFSLIKLACHALPTIGFGLFVVHVTKIGCMVSQSLGIYTFALLASTTVLLQKFSEWFPQKIFSTRLSPLLFQRKPTSLLKNNAPTASSHLRHPAIYTHND
ncbi:MAG: hypothetical protein A3F17_00420 [Gammaproteobacteria bacterium RIFCSPHIGHO2_12_FULL_41_15]|nr:MAG: hypothetical protein A3F17_00420 [Gammaproteobacteria bacterium RIFCSPHIGHO2_12_FULL_41_15]